MDLMRWRRRAIGYGVSGCGWVIALTLLSASSPLSAAEPPRRADKEKRAAPVSVFFAEIMVLHGTSLKKGIDPRIGSMPELGKPPFSSYDSYEFLERTRLLLDKQTPRTLKLPNGRTLETRLIEVLGKDTLRFSASINQPNGKEFLPLLEVKARLEQPFIVAGQSYKQGILVLVIRAVR